MRAPAQRRRRRQERQSPELPDQHRLRQLSRRRRRPRRSPAGKAPKPSTCSVPDTAAPRNRLAKGFPQDIKYDTPFDTTKFVSESIKEVYKTPLMEEIAAKTLPPGTGCEWTAMSYQEKVVGGQIYLAFGLALLLVYLVLAGQYESWYAPISVILAVPLSLLGPMIVLTGLRIENNLYTQIGIILLIALSAKNAILIVEVALEHHVRDRKPLLQSAVDAARARFRPILMTSFAFILGVVPLVLATGAGANARKSIGITVFSGMIASTCLAVLFVPAFFVVIQRFENWLKERKQKKTDPQAIPQTGP
jgi:multidrug efflux pump subunit AcrB